MQLIKMGRQNDKELLTLVTRLWNLRRNFTSTGTSQGDAGQAKKYLYFYVSKQDEFRYQDRDSACSVLDRETDKDLVPEQEDEVEKGAQDGLHELNANAPDASCSSLPAPPALTGRHTYNNTDNMLTG